jgi:hypothetical protein
VQPKGWKREGFGAYKPDNDKTREALGSMEVPYFRDFAAEQFDLNVMNGTRFAKLGDKIVVACTPNKDGTTPRAADWEQIDDVALESIKATASPQQVAAFDLNHEHWTPGPMLITPAFHASEPVVKDNRAFFDRKFCR